MHGKCIPARKVPVSPTTRHSGPSLDFIGIICGFRCYSVHELSTGWLNKGILMNEPELASIFVWCVYRGNPHQNRRKKNRHEFTLIEPRKLSNIRNTNLHFFLLFSKNQNRFLKFQLRAILLLLLFFNNISIHAKVNQSISLRCLDCGFLILNWCTYVSKYKNPRRKVNRMWKFSLYSSFFLNLIISFLQFRGSWYLWVVLFSGFFFN